jgi:hypothetical protein
MENRQQTHEAELVSIRSLISEGRTEEAKEKLLSLFLTFPPSDESPKEIGDLYWELGFHAMAGRYWYLIENPTEQMMTACKEFEHSLGDNPILIVEALDSWSRYHPLSPYIKSRLEELKRNAADFHKRFPPNWEKSSGLLDRIALLGCGVVGFILLFIFVAGVWFIAIWFK